jgi:MFS family permease
LADRYGRRLVFVIGTAVFTLGSATCALATSIPLLVGFRAIQAVGAALVMPTLLALLLAAFPVATPGGRREHVGRGRWGRRRRRASAGGLLVPLSWRWVFLVNLPVGVLALAFAPKVLRESKDTGSGVPDLLGAAGLILGVGALAWALVTGLGEGWGSTEVLIALGLTVAGLLWVVLRSARLDRDWHDSVIVAGLSLTRGPLMVVLVSLTIGGRLARRLGPGPVTLIGSVLFALGAAIWIWRIGPVPQYATGLLPGQFLTGAGVGLVLPSLSGVVGLVLPARQWGAGSSMINTARQVGTVLATAILVVLFGPAPDLAAFRRGIFLGIAALGAAWPHSASPCAGTPTPMPSTSRHRPGNRPAGACTGVFAVRTAIPCPVPR